MAEASGACLRDLIGEVGSCKSGRGPLVSGDSDFRPRPHGNRRLSGVPVARPWLPSAIVKRDVGLQAVEALRKYLMIDEPGTSMDRVASRGGLMDSPSTVKPSRRHRMINTGRSCKMPVSGPTWRRRLIPARDPAKILGVPEYPRDAECTGVGPDERDRCRVLHRHGHEREQQEHRGVDTSRSPGRRSSRNSAARSRDRAGSRTPWEASGRRG